MGIHLLALSFRLFMLKILKIFRMIYSFSLTHKSQALLPGLYVWQVFRIFRSMLGLKLRPSVQIYCDNDVAFLFASSRKEWVWLLNLTLKDPSVFPI